MHWRQLLVNMPREIGPGQYRIKTVIKLLLYLIFALNFIRNRGKRHLFWSFETSTSPLLDMLGEGSFWNGKVKNIFPRWQQLSEIILQLKTCPKCYETEMDGWSTIHFYLNNGWSTIPEINDGRPYLILDCNWSVGNPWQALTWVLPGISLGLGKGSTKC